MLLASGCSFVDNRSILRSLAHAAACMACHSCVHDVSLTHRYAGSAWRSLRPLCKFAHSTAQQGIWQMLTGYLMGTQRCRLQQWLVVRVLCTGRLPHLPCHLHPCVAMELTCQPSARITYLHYMRTEHRLDAPDDCAPVASRLPVAGLHAIN